MHTKGNTKLNNQVILFFYFPKTLFYFGKCYFMYVMHKTNKGNHTGINFSMLPEFLKFLLN